MGKKGIGKDSGQQATINFIIVTAIIQPVSPHQYNYFCDEQIKFLSCVCVFFFLFLSISYSFFYQNVMFFFLLSRIEIDIFLFYGLHKATVKYLG